MVEGEFDDLGGEDEGDGLTRAERRKAAKSAKGRRRKG